MKRKGIFSKFTASVMSALIVLGVASAAQPFAPVIFDGITVSADDTIPLTNMSELEKSSVMKGKKAVIDLAAEGGSGEYKYSVFYRRSSVSKWTTAVTDTTESTVSITAKYAEEYTISIKAVDSAGNVQKKYLTLNVVDLLQNNSELEQTEVIKGTDAIVNLSAIGGSGEYTYSVYYKRSSASKWTTAVNDTTESFVRIMGKSEGEYQVSVKVVDSLGNNKKKTLTFNVIDTLRNNSELEQTEVVKGTDAIVYLNAEGGSEDYTYSVYYKRSSASKWTTAVTDTKEQFVRILGKSEGEYQVSVKVTDSAGTVNKKYLTFNVIDTLRNNSELEQTDVAKGTDAIVYLNAEGGSEDYTFSVYYKRGSAKNWTTAITDTKEQFVKIIGKYEGEYQVSVKVTDSAGNVNKKYLTFNVIDTLENNSELEQTDVAKGTDAIVYLNAAGGSEDYTYSVYYKRSSDKNWTTVITDTKEQFARIIGKYEGEYQVSVKVTDSAGNVNKKYLAFNVIDTLENNSELEKTDVVKGTDAIVYLNAAGGSEDYTFSVYYKFGSDKSWTTVITDTKESTASIIPEYTGEYQVSVKVVDSAGNIRKKYLSFNAIDALENNSGLEKTDVIKGTKVVVYLEAAGGSGDYKYSVCYKRNSANNWTTAVTDTTESTVTITPKYAEEYQISVTVSDSSGNIQTKYFNLNSIEPISNTSTISNTEIFDGETTVINCSAENGSGNYTYSVFYKLTSSNTWKTLVQDTTTNTVSFKPDAAGTYNISVKAVDSYGGISKQYFTVTVLQKLTNKSYAEKTTVYLGDVININASAEGGKAPYTYAYYYKVSTDTNWSRLSDYSSTASIVITPQSPADYDIRVDIRDSANNNASKILTIGVVGELTNTSSINPKDKSIESGNSVTIYPNSTGYYRSVSYQIYYQVSGSSDKKYITYDASKGYVKFTPSDAGTYTITVVATDSLNRTAAKSFTLTVTANTLYNIVDGILAEIITPTMNDFEKIKAIHDWMVNYAEYDKDNYYAGTVPQSDYTAEGFFENRKAVCDGYAKAFLIMATRAGFEAIRVEGTASPAPGSNDSHAWNQVKANGKWYNIDVTWDDPISSGDSGDNLSYKYFLVPDSILDQDHFAESSKNSCTAPQPTEWLTSLERVNINIYKSA